MCALRLYSNSSLPCPQRALVTAVEKGVDLEIVETDIFSEQTKMPEFKKRQPFGAIPVLVDTTSEDEFVLYESRAISRYLAMVSKAVQTFFPMHLTPGPSGDLSRLRMFKPIFGGDPVDITTIEYLETQLASKLDVIDKILRQQEYMAGEDFSLVDIFYMPYMSKLVEMDEGAIFRNRPHIQSWWEKISSRQSYKKVFGCKDIE